MGTTSKHSWSRRDFLKGAAAGTMSVAALGALGGCSPQQSASTASAAAADSGEAGTYDVMQELSTFNRGQNASAKAPTTPEEYIALKGDGVLSAGGGCEQLGIKPADFMLNKPAWLGDAPVVSDIADTEDCDVLVIGAGNAAMDVARTAIRHGTRHLECFSLSSHITASEYEASYAKLEGVNFIFNKKPLEITDKGVVFIDLNEAEDGTLTEIPGTEKLYPADSVIVSISQGPCTTITDSTKNLKTTPRGLFETDEVGRTSIPGIFASGDAVKGARTVVEAVAYSKNVAEAMHEYMQTLPPDLPDEYANVPVAEYDEGN